MVLDLGRSLQRVLEALYDRPLWGLVFPDKSHASIRHHVSPLDHAMICSEVVVVWLRVVRRVQAKHSKDSRTELRLIDWLE